MFLRLLSIALLGLFLTGCSTFETGKTVKISPTSFGRDALKTAVDAGELPGVICVFYNNGIQENTVLGWASVENSIPLTMDNMFMQCSQTKGFCGVTIAMLVEEGKLSLDDPVSKYLPEFKNLKVAVKDKKGKVVSVKPAKNVLTVRMVMNHTGGFNFEIPTKRKKGWPALPLRATAKEAASIPLLFEPGTGSRYSNTGIDIGAAVVEVITGKPWEVFLKERVLDPLEMIDTTFNPTDEQLKRAMSLYITAPGKKAKYRHYHSAMPRPYNGPQVNPSAGAGLWTTANDQLKFYKMLMNLGVGENNKRILKEETVKNLLATNTRPPKCGSYSLGLSVGRDNWFGHGGAWGTNCWVNWQKKQLRMLVVQANGKRFWEKTWHQASEKFFKTAVDDSESAAYTGRMK